MEVVKCKELSISYKKGKVQAVKGVSFKVERGELFIFLGPDGAGKSSLLKAVCGVVTYDSGTLRVLGRDPNREKEFREVREKISFMPQGLGQSLYKKLTVGENVDFFAELYGLAKGEKERRKELLLEVTGLKPFEGRQAGKLSGGMMQKLAFCCALIHRPELLVLDEPTTGVDPVSRRELWKLVYESLKEGITVIVATSYLDEAERGTRLLLMDRGKEVAQGEPEEVTKTEEPVFLVEGEDYLKAYELLWKVSRSVRLKGKRVRLLGKEEEVRRVLKGLKVEIRRVEPELEDTLVERVGLKRVKVPRLFKPKSEVPEEAVVVEGVVKSFGDFKAVDGVSFTVKRGELFGLLGPNGAGKTTLIKTILGLYEPTSGRVTVAGRERGVKEVVGYTSQKFSLYHDLTVLENLKLWGSLYGVGRKELSEKIAVGLRLLELEEFKRSLVKELPLGIKQRVSLLSALLHSPPILLLDEPTSGVDPIERNQFWQLIGELSREFGTTALVTTHYLDEAEYCHRLLLMNRGRAVAQGSPEELKEKVREKLGKPYFLYTDFPFELEEELKGKGFKATIYGKKVKLFLKRGSPLELLKELKTKVNRIKEAQVDMEDVFVFATKED